MPPNSAESGTLQASSNRVLAPDSGKRASQDARFALSGAVPVTAPPDLPPVSKRWILVLVLALFGGNLAFATPIAYSLAIRVQELAPGRENFLGILISVGSAVGLFVGPLTGQLSDRTRSRFGRRRPWVMAGLSIGTVGLSILATAPNLGCLMLGWIVADVGFVIMLGSLGAIQGDRLPVAQRGRVAGFASTASVTAPILGVLLASSVSANSILSVMIPAIAAVILAVPFLVFVSDQEAGTRSLDGPRPSARVMLSNLVFDPRRYPDFGWNWLGRTMFFFGLSLSTTFTAYFMASRLGLPVTDVGSVVATAGLVGMLGLTVGALGSGYLSDKTGRRKPFILAGATIFAVGAVCTAVAPGLPLLLLGALLTNAGVGVFSATDQALMLDVLPERDVEAGRFIGIAGLSSGISRVLAPMAASVLLTVGTGPQNPKNYALVLLVSGLFTVLGALVILRVKSTR